jgi:hypothetical protein
MGLPCPPSGIKEKRQMTIVCDHKLLTRIVACNSSLCVTHDKCATTFWLTLKSMHLPNTRLHKIYEYIYIYIYEYRDSVFFSFLFWNKWKRNPLCKWPKQQTWAKGSKSLNTLPCIELLKVKVEAWMVSVWFCL